MNTRKMSSLKRNIIAIIITIAILTILAIIIQSIIGNCRRVETPLLLKEMPQKVEYIFKDERYSCRDVVIRKTIANTNEFTTEYCYYFKSAEGENTAVSLTPLNYEKGEVYTFPIIAYSYNLPYSDNFSKTVKMINFENLSEEAFGSKAMVKANNSIVEAINAHFKNLESMWIFIYFSVVIITIIILFVTLVNCCNAEKHYEDCEE